MGQAKQKGTKDQRVAQAIAKLPTQEEMEAFAADQEAQAKAWWEKYEASLPYTERISRANVRALQKALEGTPNDYI